jgi:hypothetical protein
MPLQDLLDRSCETRPPQLTSPGALPNVTRSSLRCDCGPEMFDASCPFTSLKYPRSATPHHTSESLSAESGGRVSVAKLATLREPSVAEIAAVCRPRRFSAELLSALWHSRCTEAACTARTSHAAMAKDKQA